MSRQDKTPPRRLFNRQAQEQVADVKAELKNIAQHDLTRSFSIIMVDRENTRKTMKIPLYTLNSIDMLFRYLIEKDNKDLKSNPNMDKLDHEENCKFRYLVTTDNQIRFGLEGAPTNCTPTHYQMTGSALRNSGLKALAAGLMLFDPESHRITCINNLSGGFRCSTGSLIWPLALINMLKPQLLAETIKLGIWSESKKKSIYYEITRQDIQLLEQAFKEKLNQKDLTRLRSLNLLKDNPCYLLNYQRATEEDLELFSFEQVASDVIEPVAPRSVVAARPSRFSSLLAESESPPVAAQGVKASFLSALDAVDEERFNQSLEERKERPNQSLKEKLEFDMVPFDQAEQAAPTEVEQEIALLMDPRKNPFLSNPARNGLFSNDKENSSPIRKNSRGPCQENLSSSKKESPLQNPSQLFSPERNSEAKPLTARPTKKRLKGKSLLDQLEQSDRASPSPSSAFNPFTP